MHLTRNEKSFQGYSLPKDKPQKINPRKLKEWEAQAERILYMDLIELDQFEDDFLEIQKQKVLIFGGK